MPSLGTTLFPWRTTSHTVTASLGFATSTNNDPSPCTNTHPKNRPSWIYPSIQVMENNSGSISAGCTSMDHLAEALQPLREVSSLNSFRASTVEDFSTSPAVVGK